jgi:hypothetical protein
MDGNHTAVNEEVCHPLPQKIGSGELKLGGRVVEDLQSHERRIKENERETS